VLRAAVREAGAHTPSEAADAEGPSGMAAERMAEQVGQAFSQGIGNAVKTHYAGDIVHAEAGSGLVG